MGRGAATMYAGSLADADCIVVEGGNTAECHPVAFRWVMQAKAKGAKGIPLDGFVGTYNNATWQYDRAPVGDQGRSASTGQSGEQGVRSGPATQPGGQGQPAVPKGPPFDPLVKSLVPPPAQRDETLQN